MAVRDWVGWIVEESLTGLLALATLCLVALFIYALVTGNVEHHHLSEEAVREFGRAVRAVYEFGRRAVHFARDAHPRV